ncbi:Protein of unknown function [Friedmanniella luteola]|uniref:Right handed beta helix region n=1 Tax=Friedmanniella luteola TaxID=546871 RepID=A0A1H1PQG8_9ACTN|nr:right-handed parallel beta-helix repeat-containing protein [Friedmanniella luteola]SDS13370.1 Protein of unknown function [Friedmanniella luteola]
MSSTTSRPTPERPTAAGSTTAFRRTAKIILSAALALAAGATPLLLPGTAAADTPLVVDGFDRSVSSGWGRADTGGSWADLVGGSSTSVTGSEGRVTNILGGRSFRAYQKAVAAEDAEVRADFTVPAAKDFIYTIEARKQADLSAYLARGRIDSAGKLHMDVMRSQGSTLTMLKEMTLETPVVVGQKLTLKLSTTGEAPVIVKGKVFVAGQNEPGWQVTFLDSAAAALKTPGYAGLQAYNGGSNAAINLATQTFAVTDTTPAPVEEPSNPTSPTPGDPSASPTPGAPTIAPPPAPPAKLATKHGADPVGSAQYPVPTNALFVSAAAGNDANAGTQDKPFKTLNKALTKNWSGQTIVLRAGTYHESVLVAPGHAATIQPYPGEKVWFDGTRAVTGFTRSTTGYVAGGWTTELDSSPTYTKGEPDGTATGWQWIDPQYPMAAHPDMVWVGDVEQTQVGSRDALVPGTFFVDGATDQLYLGADPGTEEVRASDLQVAFSLRAPGTVLRGFGVQRYADSVWQQGVISSYWERMTLDNMTVLDSATGGVGFFKPGSVIKNTTIDGSGQIALHANQADNLVLENLSVTDSNDERFNPAPSSGGIKITQTRGVKLRGSELLRTYGSQFWTDQSTYDITVAGNEILDGSRYGVVLEISSTATVADNIIAGNAFDGVLVANTDKVHIWNNTLVGNRKAIAFAQDSRRIEQLKVSGHDPRRPQPDLSMPWVIGNSTIGNNVMAAGRNASAVISVDVYELISNASDLNIATNGNVYSQTALGVPNSLATWARKGSQPYQFIMLDDFRDNTGQERSSASLVLPTPVDSAYRPLPAVAAKLSAVAQPLPSEVADRIGRTTGDKALGAWSRPTA